MSDYTKNMTVSEMREEIAQMIQCGEGFIATDEKLLEYVDDFIAKVRADAIEELINKVSESIIWDILAEIMKRNIGASEGADKIIEYLQKIAEELKEQKNV